MLSRRAPRLERSEMLLSLQDTVNLSDAIHPAGTASGKGGVHSAPGSRTAYREPWGNGHLPRGLRAEK